MDYTAQQIREIVKHLEITPFPGNRVDSRQAAVILTWRVKKEQGIEHTYTDLHVRGRIRTGALIPAGQIHSHLKLFEVTDIFALELMPKRAAGARKREEQKTAKRPAVKPERDAA